MFMSKAFSIRSAISADRAALPFNRDESVARRTRESRLPLIDSYIMPVSLNRKVKAIADDNK